MEARQGRHQTQTQTQTQTHGFPTFIISSPTFPIPGVGIPGFIGFPTPTQTQTQTQTQIG